MFLSFIIDITKCYTCVQEIATPNYDMRLVSVNLTLPVVLKPPDFSNSFNWRMITYLLLQ